MADTSSKGTILVIDDEAKMRMILSNYLTKRGWRVVEAAGGMDGVQAALAQRPMLIVMDLMMSRGDGLSALDELAENPDTADIPVIIMSGKGSRLDKMTSYDKGAYCYLEKPFDLDLIAEKAEEIIRKI